MLKSISLFSGCGGLDYGLWKAGFAPILSVEKDINARNSYLSWVNNICIDNHIMFSDINDIDPSELKISLGIGDMDVDLLCGGPPCQSFSVIGQRKSVCDIRGKLIFKMVEYAKVFKPKAVLIEQVKGFLSARDKNGRRGGVCEAVVSELSSIGYSVIFSVLRAADYGVPQLRERLFILAILPGFGDISFPSPSHFPKRSNSLDFMSSYYVTVGEAIKGLPKPVLKGEQEVFPNHVDITPTGDRNRITGVPEGEYLAKQVHLPASQRGKLHPKKDTTKFRRLAWDKPSLTLRGGECFYHPEEDRYLTPRECLRLHGYPDDFVLVGPVRGRSGQVRDLDQHRLVANSVPPPLAECLGKEIYEAILGEEYNLNKRAAL